MTPSAVPIRPSVVISIDLELSWGTVDLPDDGDSLARTRWTHDVGVPLLLSLLCEHDLTATWATVGALYGDRLAPMATRLDEVHYPHYPSPWFSRIPRNATEKEAPEWFGASLIQLIASARPAQELAFHSYSHVIFGDRGTPRTRAAQELDACRSIAVAFGIDAPSFVFPRNSVGHLDLLRAHGFRAFRAPDELPFTLPGSPGRALAGVIADVVAAAPRLVRPRVRDDLIEIPGSLMVRHAKGWRALIPDRCRARRLRRGLELVIQHGDVFHVWLHPEALYDGRPRLERVLRTFFSQVAAAVQSGRVRCLTMGGLVTEVLRGNVVPGISARTTP